MKSVLQHLNRIGLVFKKTMREMSRDGWMLALTLAFTPFFVVLYWLWFQGGSTSYTIAVINRDQGATMVDGTALHAGEDAMRALQAVTYADGKPLLKVIPAVDRAEAEALLKDRRASAFLEIPGNFSRSLLALKSGDRSVTTRITFGGDLSNTYYMVGANLALGSVDGYIQQASGQKPLVEYIEASLGASGTRSEFETYVPGTLVFSIVLLIFLASMMMAREIESGTLRRLQLTPMSSLDLIGGITAALVLLGSLTISLAFLVAILLGFHSQGPIWVALVIGAVTSLSVIGLGMVVASFTRTVSQAFVVANFPLALMMFFSGVIFPMPQVKLFTLFGHVIGPYDFLPPTHAVTALNKILTLGAGFRDVIFELAAMSILSVVYFAVGVWLLNKIHLRSH
jgi:ABC-2 type transport system permease protein